MESPTVFTSVLASNVSIILPRLSSSLSVSKKSVPFEARCIVSLAGLNGSYPWSLLLAMYLKHKILISYSSSILVSEFQTLVGFRSGGVLLSFSCMVIGFGRT